MKEFIKLKEESKQGPVKKRVPVEDLPKKAKRPYKELPSFKPRPGEKPRAFLHRVNAVTTSNLKEAQFEAKYNVDVVRTEQGEVKVKKRSEEEMLQLSGKNNKKGKKADDDDHDDDGERRDDRKSASPIKGIKKKKERFDKKKLKREKKQKIREELEKEKAQMYKKDDIKFGEIAHAPPQLKVIPRRAVKHETVARPGQKALLLHSLIDTPAIANPKKKLQSRDLGMKLKTGKLDLKGKRKELPMRTREALEDEQRSVMQQYREIKKQKLEAQQQKVPI